MSFNVQKIDNSYKIHYRNSKFYPISLTDPDALRYIAKVQQADGALLEPAIRNAITDFVVGCKSDGIWNAIKSCCILMGARTLSGALTPLVGVAPTNNGPFVSGDYLREAGLVGDGVGKYLDSNRNNNADPQDSFHAAVYVYQSANFDNAGNAAAYMGAGGIATGTSVIAWASSNNGTLAWRNRNSTSFSNTGIVRRNGLVAINRSTSASYISRQNATNTTRTQASQSPFNGNILVFGRNDASNVAGLFSNGRLTFYSIGESLDLAALDSRVTELKDAIRSALSSYSPPAYADADVNAYISAVETADGGVSLEAGVRDAINDFVVGCKADGIWSAIKASCILMGARTLAGALTPLVGVAPTNNGPFVSGDYDRRSGLVGNGVNKWLNSNRTTGADPQDDCHVSVFIDTVHSTNISRSYFRAQSKFIVDGLSAINSTTASHSPPNGQTFFGLSRASSAEYTRRLNGTSTTVAAVSVSPGATNLPFYQRDNGTQRSDGRLAFYSMGNSLSLALLDARVSAFYTAIRSVIP